MRSSEMNGPFVKEGGFVNNMSQKEKYKWIRIKFITPWEQEQKHHIHVLHFIHFNILTVLV